MKNDYAERQEARKQRYAELAASKAKKGQELCEAGHNALSQIPFGQPILIGHHSERADRNYRARGLGKIARGFAEMDKADHYAAKAESVGTAGVSSDDPEAIQKLKAKLSRFEAERDRWQAIVKAWRMSPEVTANGVSPRTAALAALNLTKDEQRTLELCPWYGQRLSPTYAANIRSTKKRIEELERAEQMETRPDVAGDGYTIRENKEGGRIQFLFDGKPSEQVRGILKHRGFRWSPSENAWQTWLNNRGRFNADRAHAEILALCSSSNTN